MIYLKNNLRCLICCALLISSCSIKKYNIENVTGTYRSVKQGSYLELKLGNNHTFEYQNVSSMYNSRSKGKWLIKNNNLYLTSDNDFKTNMIDVSEFKNSKQQIIVVKDEEDIPYENVIVILYTYDGLETFHSTNNLGEITIPENLVVKQIEVQYLGETYFYKTTNEKRSYKILLYLDNLSKTFFENELVKLNSRKIVLNGEKLFKTR